MPHIRTACRVLPATLALIVFATAPIVRAQAPERSTGESQGRPATIAATAIIRGRVVSAATGLPLRGAEVRVRWTNGRDNRLTTTDDQGRFEVRDLASGSWGLKASKPGYVTQQYGQNHPLEIGATIDLENGQRFTTDISLIRGSAIGGRVLDEWGEPSTGATVQVMRTKMVRGLRQLAAAAPGDVTDDRGAFRVYGLVPGDYYVRVLARGPEYTPAGGSDSFYVYFPGARSAGLAQRITLGPADDQPGLVITIPPRVPGVSVSGQVLSAAGAPAAGVLVHLYDAEDVRMGVQGSGIVAPADADGRFTARNVQPGNYVLEMMRRGGGGPEGIEIATAPLAVGTDDVSGITITTRRAVTLTGTVVVEGGAALPSGLQISIHSLGGPSITSSLAQMSIGDDRPEMTAAPFTLPGLSGRVAVDVRAHVDGWAVKAIELNGSDVTDTAIDLNGYGTTATLRVVLTNRTGELNGTVSVRGQPRAASVIVFPEDPGRWTYPSRLVRVVKTGADGQFRMPGLPPGERYKAVALSYIEQDESQDPEFLDRIQSSGTEFTLSAGEKKRLTLTPVAR